MKTCVILLVLLSTLVFTCCKKNKGEFKADLVKPVITLNNDPEMTIVCNTFTMDPGARAIDETDGDISNMIVSNWFTSVIQNKTGDYTVRYSVSDKNGNNATALRKVAVRLAPASLPRGYNTKTINSNGNSSIFTSSVSPGSSANQIVIAPFASPGIFLKVTMGGEFNNLLSFDQTEGGVHYTGTGTITNSGRNIDIICFATTGSATVTYTQTMYF